MHNVWHNQLLLHDSYYESPSNALIAHCKLVLVFVYQFLPGGILTVTEETCNVMPIKGKFSEFFTSLKGGRRGSKCYKFRGRIPNIKQLLVKWDTNIQFLMVNIILKSISILCHSGGPWNLLKHKLSHISSEG